MEVLLSVGDVEIIIADIEEAVIKRVEAILITLSDHEFNVAIGYLFVISMVHSQGILMGDV